jgi:hypothetical protein
LPRRPRVCISSTASTALRKSQYSPHHAANHDADLCSPPRNGLHSRSTAQGQCSPCHTAAADLCSSPPAVRKVQYSPWALERARQLGLVKQAAGSDQRRRRQQQAAAGTVPCARKLLLVPSPCKLRASSSSSSSNNSGGGRD